MYKQKIAAWILLLVFYSEFLGNLYASEYRGGYYAYKFTNNNNLSFKGHYHRLGSKKVIDKLNNSFKVDNTKTINDEICMVSHTESGGPSQPEMSSFKSANADNMVNLFSGAFSYNIPLMDVGGYPINISYSGGATMEEEASWVGLGWNINPGSITRNMRGMPDDFNGADSVIKEQNAKPDETYGVGPGASFKLFGFKIPDINFNYSFFWNNKTGFGTDVLANIGLSLGSYNLDEKTSFSPGLNVGLDLNSQSGLTIKPSFSISAKRNETGAKFGNLGVGTSYNSREGMRGLQITGEVNKNISALKNQINTDCGYNMSAPISFASATYAPSIKMPYTTSNYSFDFKLGGAFWGTHPNVNLKGYYKQTKIKSNDQIQIKRAYGYLHLDSALKDPDGLMDFNRMNDGVYTQNSPMISIPYYTYDVFSISGEGTGGSFRPYHGDLGYVRDPFMQTKTESLGIGLEVGGGTYVHVGADLNFTNCPTTVGKWSNNSDGTDSSLKFNGNSGNHEGVYFKNPGEKAIIDKKFLQGLGCDSLVRVKLDNTDPGGFYPNMPIATSQLDVIKDDKTGVVNTLSLIDPTTQKPLSRKTRDKRSQVISYLTADEARHVGFDKTIRSYVEGSYGQCGDYTPIQRIDQYRKPNHISEINVLETDGKRYIYGTPVYNINQQDVSFSTTGSVDNTGTLVKYNNNENTLGNTSGEEQFFQLEKMPAYAHSFLLTALLSPDYVDVTGDGITNDDLGDAINFKYTETTLNSSTKTTNPYNWRAPFSPNSSNLASFNEGLKTDAGDHKGSYVYGQKEQWYMHSIESKNFLVIFRLSNREDDLMPLDSSGSSSETSALRKLSRIDLYSKAAYANAINNGINPKPIKSVLFFYNHSLCKGFPLNKNMHIGSTLDTSMGKLTLTRIAFSFNGNDKRLKNIYKFQYENNPNYQRGATDRWGSYKPQSDNPMSMSNIDYPYSVQNNWATATNVDKNAGAWNLSKIMLPAGGEISVKYEANDYAYVQNRRAMQSFKILGFGSNSSDTHYNILHPYQDTHACDDYNYAFIQVPTSVTSTTSISQHAEILQKYLSGVNQLAFKLWVELPKDNLGNSNGWEPMTLFANVVNYGVTANNNIIWIQIGTTTGGGSQLMESAVNFLRTKAPFKAYPESNVNPNASAPLQFVRSLVGIAQGLFRAFSSFDERARSYPNFSEVLCDGHSTVRLNSPYYCKKGGGYRVKEIRIRDNWDTLTKNSVTANGIGEHSAEYGQHYDYTTTISMNGTSQSISSGVATYEPMIGAEENPFKEALQYQDKVPLGPTDFGFIDLPLAETFFPAPMVGYSQVRVTSINNNNTIHNIKSGVGTQETKFYTSKDFPTFSDFSPFDASSSIHYKPDPILQFLQIDTREMITLSQGFRVELNDMNGKMKSQASYPENDSLNPINYTQYFYKASPNSDSTYKLSNTVQAAGSNGVVESQTIGEDVELMFDSREHKSETTDFDPQVNVDVVPAVFFPVPISSFFSPPTHSSTTFRSVTCLKVVNQYGIIDSVIQIDKGSMVTTRNLVYDQETGDVLLTQTQNEYNQPIYNFNYPAYWAYCGMSQAYQNIGVQYSGVSFLNGILQPNSNGTYVDASGTVIDTTLFESGDEIYVNTDQNSSDSVLNCRACLLDTNRIKDHINLPSGIDENGNAIYKIWALDIAKDTINHNHKFVFIDKDGNPYNASSTNIKIVRSGKRNQINASVGSISSLENPIVGGTISISSSSNVVKSGAQTFNEKWRGEDAFYTIADYQNVKLYAPIHTAQLSVDSVTVQTHYHPDCSVWQAVWGCPNDVNIFIQNPTYIESRCENTGGGNHSDYNSNSYLKFKLPSSLYQSTILIDTAKLSLFAHTGVNFTNATPVTHSLLNSSLKNNSDSKKLSLMLPTGGDGGGGGGGGSSITWSHDPTAYMTKAQIHYAYNSNEAEVNQPTEDIFQIYRDTSRQWLTTNVLVDNSISATGAPSTSLFSLEQLSGNDTISFCSSCLYGSDNRIDVSGIVSQMIVHPEHVSAIQLVLPPPNSDNFSERRVCFSSGLGSSNEGEGPLLDIKYCNKTEAYGLPGNLASPPAGIAVDSFYANELVTNCYSVFTRKRMNPYQHGLLGNWRTNKSYVFYGTRGNTTAENTIGTSGSTSKTDLRSYGVIKNFSPYWLFSGSGLNVTTNVNWVWNSELSQVNRKGLEIENFDALMRFNSGQYGYNDNLPVAVTNNARYRETGFDGFEDYGYTDASCAYSCSDEREKTERHWYLSDSTEAYITQSVSHTGLSSLQLPPGKSFSFTNAVVGLPVYDSLAVEEAHNAPDLHIKFLNTPFIDYTGGTGLTGTYNPSTSGGTFIQTPDSRIFASVGYSGYGSQYNDYYPPSLRASSAFTINWTGKFNIHMNGNYNFGVQFVDNSYTITITDVNNNVISPNYSLHSSGGTNLNTYTDNSGNFTPYSTNLPENYCTYSLTSGVYNINVAYINNGGPAFIRVLMQPPFVNEFSEIPSSDLFPFGTTPNTNIVYCQKPDSIQALKNGKIDSFAIIPGKQMVLSCWVKEGNSSCQCKAYTKDSITVNFSNSSGIIAGAGSVFTPSGNIIEGWQRYECVLTAPTNATSITVNLKNSSSTNNVYFDDLRILPFNSNMKSFVYNPINLRLMAELDENNYATFYEYDEDGTLARVKKETEQGIKTIKETRSALQKLLQ